MENRSKIALLGLKWAQRPPWTHWDPQGLWKLFFRVARIWKPHAGKKNFWFISHRKKVGLTKPGAWQAYSIFGLVSRNIKDFFKISLQMFLNYIGAKEILSGVKLFRKSFPNSHVIQLFFFSRCNSFLSFFWYFQLFPHFLQWFHSFSQLHF